MFIHEITDKIVENYLQSLRAKNGVDKAAPKTWNNNRKGLHRFFAWCCEKPQKYIEVNPVAHIKLFKIDKGDVRTISAEKAEAIMRYVETFNGGL